MTLLTFMFVWLCLHQQLEVVPLFGDMQIAPFNYVRTSASFDASRWPMCTSSQTSSQSNLLASLDGMRCEHDRYISELARHSNEVCTSTSRLSANNCSHHKLNPLKCSGIGWLHLELFNAIQV